MGVDAVDWFLTAHLSPVACYGIKMAKNLVIVESPAKAKTINKYLGSDYHVMASLGHIKDLPKKGLGVDVENNFEPTYEVNDEPRKKKVVAELKKRGQRGGRDLSRR